MQHGYKVNLDLLRAAAITVVVAFHVSQYTAISPVWQQFFAVGTFGVDLFFVLSGWLIGGIFFREYRQAGHVNMARFWGRRWLRTMPPYYVALLVSWLAAYAARHQAFDPKFLFFGQNYSPIPPFFLVSWSLCIEEHFYLFLPLILYVGLKFDAVVSICLSIIALSIFARLTSHVIDFPAFGYLLTATHLRLDGLSLGVLCAYMHMGSYDRWQRFSSFLKPSGIIFGVAGLLLYLFDGQLMYSFGILFISISFAGLLCFAVDTVAWRVSSTRLVSFIASASYSIYLTHALAIHFTRQFLTPTGFAFVLCSLLLTVLVGYVFHAAIEGTSKKVRDRLFPAPATLIPARNHVSSVGRRKSKVLPAVLRLIYRDTLSSAGAPEQADYVAKQSDLSNAVD